MIKKKYIALTLMLPLLGMSRTYASCTQEEINEFIKIKDEYKITYEFDKDTKTYTLNLIRANPDMYDYIIYLKGNLTCNDINEKETECLYFSPGTYRIEIVGQTNTCSDTLKELTLELPKYNEYSEDPLCEGIEEFVLCQSTYDKEIDYDTFVSRVNTYKRTKQEKESELNEENNQNEFVSKVTTYIKENLLKIIIIIVFIILISITSIITYKSIRKSRRLE